VVAAERLRKLGRLPVPDRLGDVLDRDRAVGQELGRPRHPDVPEVVPEGGSAGLGECPLELAP
jgi:hypothetical protein